MGEILKYQTDTTEVFNEANVSSCREKATKFLNF